MFTKAGAVEPVPMLAGVDRRTLAHGQRTLLAEFHLARGHVIPPHAHPHEQTGYLVSGRLRFTIAHETHEVRSGDGWCVAGGVQHSVEILEDSVAIEVFSPVREDYLPAAG